jgi:hypothetical protein
MQFSEIRKRIKSYLEDQDGPAILNEEEIKIIDNCFKLISDDIHRLIDGDELEQNDTKFSLILSSLLLVSGKTLEGPISDSFGTFVAMFAELVYNWNSNASNDEVLRQLCMYISRTSESRTVMVKSINVMKNIDDRMKLLHGWAPAAYDISKAYFEELLKENEKEQV